MEATAVAKSNAAKPNNAVRMLSFERHESFLKYYN